MPVRESVNEPETVIAASVKVEGDFNSQGNILIEGVVEGRLTTSKDLRVGERAHISADVHASNANIAGEISGNINIAERLELEPSARISGDIRTKILTVAPGAIINGRVIMGEQALAGMPEVSAASYPVDEDEDEADDEEEGEDE